MSLHPKHYAELHDESGISPEVILASGAYTETTPEGVQRIGFAPYQARPGLVFPYTTVNGWSESYAIKPDDPRTETRPNGKVRAVKYEYPEGSANHIYCPPQVRDALADASIDLLITEGIKKTLAAISRRYPCVGLPGVWNWLTRRDTPFAVPLADWGHINCKGRRIGLAFDSDMAHNENVRLACDRLAHLLIALGAHVYVVILPPAPDGSKQGLDDYLVRNPGTNPWDLAQPWQEGHLAELQRERDEARHVAAEATAIKSNMVYALRNDKIKAERMPLVSTVNYLEAKHAAERPIELPGKGGGWYPVPTKAIAEQAGCSPKTAGKHMDSGARWGLYEKTLDFDPRERVDLETGEKLPPDGPKKIFLRRLRPASETLAAMIDLDPPKAEGASDWGGKREPTCPDHPHAGTVKKWTLHCQECDRLLDAGETHRRPKYGDDTAPDRHAEDLVGGLNDPISQDDPYSATAWDDLYRRAEAFAVEPPTPISQDDPPRLRGGGKPGVTPISQDDPYPPALSRELYVLPMFSPPMSVCAGCPDPDFCRGLGHCPFADHLKPRAPSGGAP